MAASKLWGSELEYRRTVLKVVLIVIMVAGSVFAVNNWYAGYPVFAMVEFAVVLLSGGILFIHKKTPHFTLWSSIFLFSLYTVILIGIYMSSFNSALYCWLYIVPVLSYLLLGTRIGTVFTSLYTISGVIILIFAQLINNPDVHTISIFNIGLTLVAIWALSFTYEHKRDEMVKRLQQMAAVDPLTGLNNRLLLSSIFKMLCESLPEQQQSVSMLLIDLDHFKKINDQFGHDVGDQVLIEVSRLLNNMRRRNDWAFRFGGEEFCLLIPDTSLSQAQKIANRLRLAIEQDLHVIDCTSCISVSIGIARWPEDGLTLAEIYKVADTRLYQAKEQGRNTVVSG